MKTNIRPNNLPEAKTTSLPGIETLKLGLISITIAVEIFKNIGRRKEIAPDRIIQRKRLSVDRGKNKVITAIRTVTG